MDPIRLSLTRKLSRWLKLVDKNLSASRKIFRFLKFTEDIRKFLDILNSETSIHILLKIVICLFSTIYHFLENLTWLANLKIISPYLIEGLEYKTSKHFFKLIRTSFKLIFSCFNLLKIFLISEIRINKPKSKLTKLMINICHKSLQCVLIAKQVGIKVPVDRFTLSCFHVVTCLFSLYKAFLKNNDDGHFNFLRKIENVF